MPRRVLVEHYRSYTAVAVALVIAHLLAWAFIRSWPLNPMASKQVAYFWSPIGPFFNLVRWAGCGVVGGWVYTSVYLGIVRSWQSGAVG